MSKNLFDRYIEIVFVSTTYGKEISISTKDAVLEAQSFKFLSNLKDESNIIIYNLTYDWVNELVARKYDVAKIYAGYGDQKYFVSSNTILSITVDKSDLNTPKTIIVCSTKFQSKQNQSIKFNEGTTIYAALNILTRKLALRAIIDPRLKNKILTQKLIVQYASVAITQILRDYSFISVSNDTGDNNFDISFKEIFNGTNTYLEIKPENGTLIRDWATIEGNTNIRFLALPIIDFRIGSIVSVDKKYINRFIDSSDSFIDFKKTTQVLLNTQTTVDGSNLFVIISLKYNLSITDSFDVEIIARPYFSFQRKVLKGGV